MLLLQFVDYTVRGVLIGLTAERRQKILALIPRAVVIWLSSTGNCATTIYEAVQGPM